MISFLKNRVPIVNKLITQYEQSRISAENEYLAMSCGAFNPQFLAQVKRSQADSKRNKDKTKYQ